MAPKKAANDIKSRSPEGSDASDSDDGQSSDEEDQSREQLVHWWCKKQLGRCLKNLQSLPEAGPFLKPIPWQELGLTDYPDIIKEPVDLETIAERLRIGEYEDDEGLIDPDFFWEDVALIWENCKKYYEGDEDAEPFQMADHMKEEADGIEDDFWAELERFEQSLEEPEDKSGVADVAAGHVEDLITSVADWWWGAKPEEQAPAVEVAPTRNVKKVVIETMVGKGLIKMTLQTGIPTGIRDREALINDTVESLATSVGVSPDDIEVDWDLIFKDADTVPNGRATGNQLDVAYSVRLDDAKRIQEVVDEFSIAKTKRNLQKDLGGTVICTVAPMKLSKLSRRTLGDHFFDVILEQCDYDASRDLLEIEDDLTAALRDVLSQIEEIDENEKHASMPSFPEVEKKKPLHLIHAKAPKKIDKSALQITPTATTPRSRMSVNHAAQSKRRGDTGSKRGSLAASRGVSPAVSPRVSLSPHSGGHRMSFALKDPLAALSKDAMLKDLMNNSDEEDVSAVPTSSYDYSHMKPRKSKGHK